MSFSRVPPRPAPPPSWALGGLGVLLLLSITLFGRGLALYVDWLWFGELGYRGVFWTRLLAQWVLGAAAGAGTFLWLWTHHRVARAASLRPRPVSWGAGPADRLALLDRAAPVAFLFVGFLAGLAASSGWENFLLFRGGSAFGEADPVFGKELGFFIFQLPFWKGLHGFAFFLLAAGFAVPLAVYLAQREVRIDGRFFDASPRAQAHFALWLVLLFLWVSAACHLGLYDRLTSRDGTVFGATYADLQARLPALKALRFMSLVAAALSFAPFVRRGRRAWAAPIAAASLLLAGGLLGRGLYPRFLQKFKVTPNELVLETPAIERNIAATRRAFGLAGVKERPFAAAGGLDAADLAAHRSTLANVRLWDHRPLLDTFSQLQEIRTYYKFAGVDNDRYRVDGEYRQVMLSLRELDHSRLPSRSWINEHLTYTHGYGLVLGPVNEVSSEGLPRLWVRDIPPAFETDLRLDRPEIYYGEISNEYVLVNTGSKELDYPSGDANVYAPYQGRGGVPLGGWLRKAALALHFRAFKILLSRDVTADSRVLFHRQVAERVRRLAPFFLYDADPYPVLAGGRVFWVIDGYSWTDRYPCSQPLGGGLNYIRNSVKAVVDAYDGTVDFYQADAQDPVARAYAAAFPGLLKPLSAMPAELRAHLRYPQGLFDIQARVLARYHMTDPQVFYNQEDLWATPTEILQGGETTMQPYYTLMRLPGGEREEYVLMLPFTPRQKNNLIAWMVARSDGDNYGELIVYRFPKEKLVYGPMQIEARIDQDAEISQQFTLWGQRGVQVLRGNMVVLPMEESLLYVEPVYLQAERGKIPELRRVIVAYEDRIAMAETLDGALRGVFDGAGGVPASAARPAPAGEAPGPRAWTIFQKGRDALRRGEWAGFGRAMDELEVLLKEWGSPK